MEVWHKTVNSELINLIREVAYKECEVTLSSGKKSNFYVDCRKVILHPNSYVMYNLIACTISPQYRHGFIAGVELGGALLVPSIVGRTQMYGLVVRKEAKSHGIAGQVVGDIERLSPRQNSVVLLEDVITTGDSVLRAARVLEDAGAIVVEIIVIVDRQEGGREVIESAGYKLHSLVTKEDIIG